MASLQGEGAQDPSVGHGGRRNVIQNIETVF